MGYGNSPHLSHPILHHVRPSNYVYQAYSLSGEYGGHQVYFDEKGHRNYLPNNSPEKGIYTDRIAVLGDSFVEAIELPYEQTLSGILDLSSKLHVQFKNYGCSSYSPVLYYLQWINSVSNERPTHVVCVLYGNDIRDDHKYYKGAIRDRDSVVSAVPGPKKKVWVSWARSLYTARFVRRLWQVFKWKRSKQSNAITIDEYKHAEENPELAGVSAEYIKRLQQLVEESGARFTLTAVPSKFALIDPSLNKEETFYRNAQKWATRNDVEWLDLASAFQHAADGGCFPFFKEDIHFNRAGHQLFASTFKSAYPFYFNLPEND